MPLTIAEGASPGEAAASGQATVEVAVALPVAGTFSYSVPDELRERIGVGSRVVVPFGSRKVSGVVVAVGGQKFNL